VKKKKPWMFHIAATIGFVVLGALALGSATTEQPVAVAFVHVREIMDFPHIVNAELVTITGYMGEALDVQIPDQMDGMPVVRIGPSAFAARGLIGVAIPGSVTRIDDGAFALNQLTSIEIPDSVTHIGNRAFANNQMLAGITIGDGIGFLYEGVFEDSLRHVSRISIGLNVDLRNSEFSSSVWREFRSAYEANDRRAGVYTLGTAGWTWQSR